MSLLSLLGIWMCASAHAQATPPPPPSTASTMPSMGPQDRQWRTSMSMGLAYLAVRGSDAVPDSTDNVGLALQSRSGAQVGNGWRLSVGYGLGFTEFQRTAEMWNQASSIGRWTTQAYADVYQWSKRKGEDDALAPVRWTGSMLAYSGLTVGYILAGGMHLGSPLASLSSMHFDVLAGRYLGGQDDGFHLAGGMGLIGFSHPHSARLRAGVGPVVVTGLDLDRLTIGARVGYSPAGWQADRGIEGSAVLTTSLTIGTLR